MKNFKGWIIGLIVIVLIAIWGVGSYNGLVSSSERVDSYNAQIQTVLQRRADLIPNLVSTVKGYASHEKEVINSVAEARAKLSGAKNISEQAAANDELSGAISRLLVVVENYPNLKADVQFKGLMDELAGTENRIAVSRRDYNNAVKEYNTKIRRFPTVLVAKIGGFDKRLYFEASDDAQTAPKVNF